MVFLQHLPTQTEDTYEKWESYSMPSLVNHTIDYAHEKMKNKKVHFEVIGDGTSVVGQYQIPISQSIQMIASLC